MTGRDYLGRLFEYQEEIDRVEDRMLRMRDSHLVSCLTDMPRAASRDNQAQEKKMIAYAEYNEQKEQMEQRLKDMKLEATSKLALLSKASYEQVLYFRYIDMDPWPVVAEKMDGKTVDNAYRLHREALRELDTILADDPYIS